MAPNNNLNVLPFYDSIEKQNHRRSYAYGSIFALLSEKSRILPFQIIREHSAGATVNKCNVIELDSGNTTDILCAAQSAGLGVKEFASEGYDIIINPSLLILPLVKLPTGNAYIELGDTAGNTWYSEIFTATTGLSECLKLTYWDQDDFVYPEGHIDYSSGFKNTLYLPTEVGKPEYPFEEEVESRDGHVFIEKQISEKKYKFNFIAPEYLCDALRIVRMHDFIRITSRGETYTVENIVIDPSWEEQGDIASVNVEFECDTVIKKIGKASITQTGGDFNNDFNNDYNT